MEGARGEEEVEVGLHFDACAAGVAHRGLAHKFVEVGGRIEFDILNFSLKEFHKKLRHKHKKIQDKNSKKIFRG